MIAGLCCNFQPNQPKKLGETHTENKITFETSPTEPSIYAKVLASLCKAFVLGKSLCIGSNKKAAIFCPACNIRFCFQLFAHIAWALINEQANDWEHPVELSFWKISGSSFVKKVHTWFLLSRHDLKPCFGCKIHGNLPQTSAAAPSPVVFWYLSPGF